MEDETCAPPELAFSAPARHESNAIAARSSTSGNERKRVACARNCLTFPAISNTITIRLPEELDQWLEEESRKTGLPKGRIVRQQLEASRTKKARQPFLDLAGSVEGKPDLSQKRGFER